MDPSELKDLDKIPQICKIQISVLRLLMHPELWTKIYHQSLPLLNFAVKDRLAHKTAASVAGLPSSSRSVDTMYLKLLGIITEYLEHS